MLFDGEVVHLEVLPEHHGRWGFRWKDALAWALSMKDPFQVGIHATNEKCLRFMDRNNWPRIAADDKFITYEVSSKAPPHHVGRRGRKRAAGWSVKPHRGLTSRRRAPLQAPSPRSCQTRYAPRPASRTSL